MILKWEKLKYKENHINAVILAAKAAKNETWAYYYHLKKQQRFLKKYDSKMLCCDLKTFNKLKQTKKIEYESNTTLTFFSSMFKFSETNLATVKLLSF